MPGLLAPKKTTINHRGLERYSVGDEFKANDGSGKKLTILDFTPHQKLGSGLFAIEVHATVSIEIESPNPENTPENIDALKKIDAVRNGVRDALGLKQFAPDVPPKTIKENRTLYVDEFLAVMKEYESNMKKSVSLN